MNKFSKRVSALQSSLIRTVAEEGMKLDGVIPLWFGEGYWPTSTIAINAAIQALRSNDHFYQPNSEKMSLRQEISDYLQRIYGIKTQIAQITVTASGMQRLALVAITLVDTDDHVVSISPAWPNIDEAFRI
ncbi:MAG: aminotransferase class I/II-fold pyridoxal phosphate-dependent enzyme [Rhodospirillaceae bacterium]|nr:aminotransferase class I/II-fold pyridoxal phosphate-dependent enzyme [Rhodospirillaceae bacterium]MBT5245155.1 aminotransferase class I/II-fold pyridoxal phosphate-dependent enzyme [Rhodospirillaceae bacterium]